MKNHPEKTAWRLVNESYPEKMFQKYLNERGYSDKYNIVREYSVFPFFIDFAFIDLKLAIELDGGGHYTLEGDAYDVTRTQVLFHDYGIRILRFENREVLQELQRVIYEITEVIKKIQRGEEFVCRSWR